MTLGELMGPEAKLPGPWRKVPIEGLTADSRAVKPGYLFAALPGSRTDGSRYIAEALQRGAAAILVPQGAAQALDGTPVVEDADPRRRLALIAARFFGAQPEDRRRRHRHQRQDLGRGLRAPDLGVDGLSRREPRHRRRRRTAQATQSLAHTTPDPVELHRILAELARDRRRPIWRSKRRAMGSTQYRARWRAARRRRPSPTSPATISTITRASRTISTPSCGCSRELLPPGAAAVDQCRYRSPAEDVSRLRQGARPRGDLPSARTGETLRLSPADAATASASASCSSITAASMTICLPLVGDFQASNALVAAGLVIAAARPRDGARRSCARMLEGAQGRLDLVGDDAKRRRRSSSTMPIRRMRSRRR